MKKILLLGGSRYIIPVIEACHSLGYMAITCDYLPNNYAHEFADAYYNVSIIDKDAVLNLAKELEVDGILSFGCDPGVETMAYVCEKLSLPCAGSYKSVLTLQNKAMFRKFLTENGFNVPRAKGYSSAEEALQDAGLYRWPVIVKPVDSAGSKGVKKIEKLDELMQAVDNALSYSKTKCFIMEEFIQQKGFSSDTDCFSINGELAFLSFSNQYFDSEAVNPYAPSAFSWPSTMPTKIQGELRSELQRLMRLLQLHTSIYNIETRQGVDGKSYIMEVSPRGGGNRLAEMLRYASGTDLIINSVRAAVGDEIQGIDGDPVYDGHWAEVILHANKSGRFSSIWIAPEIQHCIVGEDLWVREGDEVHAFNGANDAIGTLVMRFDRPEVLKQVLENQSEYIKVILDTDCKLQFDF